MPTNPPDHNTSSPFASWNMDHAGIRVGDIDAAVAWYVDTLDCRLVRRWSLGTKQFVWLAPPGADEFIIELLTNSVPETQPLHDNFKLLSRSHLGFLVVSVNDAIAELKRSNVTVISEPRDVKEASRRVAFFVDPWGNLIEVMEAISV